MGNYTPNPFMTQPAHLPPLSRLCLDILFNLRNYRRKNSTGTQNGNILWINQFVTLVGNQVLLYWHQYIQIIFKILQWMSLHSNNHGALVQSGMGPIDHRICEIYSSFLKNLRPKGIGLTMIKRPNWIGPKCMCGYTAPL